VPGPPVCEWTLDLATARLLLLMLGRQWMILPGLIAEAIPGLAALPFWVLVVRLTSPFASSVGVPKRTDILKPPAAWLDQQHTCCPRSSNMDMPKKVEVEPVKPVMPPVKVEPVKVEPIKVEPVKVDPVKAVPAPPIDTKH
jgi:hypothetical protein